ncbi:AraC family transcriptional regulator [Sphingobacterium thermophilum]|uniref:Helix-turn-helix domain-containing protein n=1 Tax=Sphingobacterium thermophilum TaxID=768534 RepID=A0ABP8QZN7_9SPHI
MNELFKIYKVGHFEAEKIDQSPNNPHQHDFEELIIGIKGQLMHFIDFETQTINAPFISFVSKGKIHRASPKKVEGECDFWVIRFKTEFIPEITFQLYNYYHVQANFRLTTSYAIQRLDTLCRLIYEEYVRQNSELAIIKDLLTALLTVIESERKKVSTTTVNLTNNQNTTFKNFLTILEENFRRPEGVAFYAEKLFMSPKSLNTLTQNILHQSVSELIETRKLIEAKRLLLSTDKSIAEIGFELGYSDKAYFTNVFKKKSGQTPSEFREEMKNMLS